MGTMSHLEFLDIGYNNSYMVITNKVSLDILIEEDINRGEGITFLIHDPDKPVTKKILEKMINHFVKSEEYEKCAELKNMIDENKFI